MLPCGGLGRSKLGEFLHCRLGEEEVRAEEIFKIHERGKRRDINVAMYQIFQRQACRTETHFLSPRLFTTSFSAPKLVQSSPSFTSKPMSHNLVFREAVLSLLEFEQKRRGTLASRRRLRAETAEGIGVVPICSVPDRSMSRARMGEREGDMAV